MLPDEKKKDYMFQGRAQLSFVMADLHTNVRVIRQALFDVAEHPEYIPVLREDVRHG
jgi:Cytochrome P450